jgi:ABC-type multidrug transport system ATPase subunit
MTEKPWIVADGVGKRYGQHEAVKPGCNFSLRSSEVVGLAGPNGAGKTTIARMACGFTAPTVGRLTLDGLSADRFRERSGVGYLPEELPRPWRCTVDQLLGLRAEAAEPKRTSSILQILDISERDQRQIPALSKGQWRLVLAAYSSIAPSRLIVLDEPDSGLDPTSLDRVRTLVEFCSEAGATVLISSHHLYELEAVCDRVLFIESGRTIAEETRAQYQSIGLRERYRQILCDTRFEGGSNGQA